MIFDLTKRKGGDEYFVSPKTGCIYPRILHQEIQNFSIHAYGSNRWRFCDNLEEATIIGLTQVLGGANIEPFSDCPSLKRLVLPNFTNSNTTLAKNTPQLQEVELGSIGNSVTALYSGSFSNDTQYGLTITVFVADSTTIPLANAPWGAKNATIVYRSSSTGEVRTV